MITAKEALELTQQSEIAINRRLEQISEKIVEAAKLGNRGLWLTDALPHHTEFRVEEKSFRLPEFTPIQRLIEIKLKELGFSMKINQREVTIGGGLGSLDEKPRQEMAPYIYISW